MNSLDALLSTGFAYRLGLTLLHSVWQGAVVAGVFGILLLLIPRRRANARYMAGCVSLLSVVLLCAVTFVTVEPRVPVRRFSPVAVHSPERSRSVAAMPPAEMAAGGSATPFSPSSPTAARSSSQAAKRVTTSQDDAAVEKPWRARVVESARAKATPLLPWLARLWLVGVGALSIWRLGGLIATFRLRRSGTSPVSREILDLIARLAERLQVRRQVRAFQSAVIETPAVIGHLRPIILLPVSAITGLSADAIEAIVAHELAHIRRHDYLVNIIQTAVETLLFHHPAVWWISHCIRAERENCCDDIALEACGDRLCYARALAQLQLGARAGLAAAATGGSLLARIRRIAASPAGADERSSRWLAGALTIALVLGLGVTVRLTSLAGAAPVQTPPSSPRVFSQALQGKVVDGSGRPVNGAQVVLYYNRSPWGLDNKTIETVSSDAEGRFKFSAPLSFKDLSNSDYTDHYLLFAKHAERAVAWDLIFSDGPKPSYTLVVTEPVSQIIQVTDAQEHPLAGVRVGLSQSGMFDAAEPSLRKSFHVGADPGILSETTDSQGRVTIRNLPKTSCAFTAILKGYGPGWARVGTPGKQEVSIRLTRAASVTGVVRDKKGRGVPDAVVSFAMAGKINHYTLVKTDADGRYVVDNLLAKGGSLWGVGIDGGYHITVRHLDYAAKPKEITLKPGESAEHIDFEAVPGVLVNGKVVEPENGRPLPGARVEANSPAGRLGSYADANGEFHWRTLPGELFAFFSMPPGGMSLTSDPNGMHGAQRLTVADDESVIELTIRAPGPIREVTTVHGRLLKPDGSPAAGIMVYPMAAAQTLPARTGAEGTVEFANIPVGGQMNLYAELKNRDATLATRLTIPSTKSPYDCGELKMKATREADLLLTDAEGEPLADTRLKMGPSFGESNVPWLAERLVQTDSSGRLKVNGITPGLQYLLRDARYETSQAEWLQAFHAVVTLIPAGEASSSPASRPPQRVVLSTQVALRVNDPSGKAIRIRKLLELTVTIPDGHWQLGPRPEIVSTLEDGSVLIDRQFVALAHPGYAIEVLFEPQGAAPLKATGVYPGDGLPLTLVAAGMPEREDAPAGTHLRVEPNEVAGLVLDAEGNPVEGATVSFPRGTPRIPPLREPVVTGLGGVFRFPEFGPYFHYMQVDKPGYATRWITDLTPGQGIAIRLDNTTRVKGAFLQPDGSPAGKATITLVCDKPTTRAQMGFSVRDLQLVAETNDRGEYDLLVEPGEYEARIASANGHFARQSGIRIEPGKTVVLPRQLEPGLPVKMRCVDIVSGAPVAGARILIEKSSPGLVEPQPDTERETDAQGIAEWKSVMPGLSRFHLRKEGYTQWWSPDDAWQKKGQGRGIDSINLDIKRDMPVVTVEMEKGVKVSGRVLAPDGTPASGIGVDVTGLATGDARYQVRATDEQGRFEQNLPAGKGIAYALSAYDPKGRWANAVSDSFSSKPGDEREFMLRMTVGGRAQGRLLDESGRPLPEVEVGAVAQDQKDNPYFNPRAMTDTQGRFELGPMRPGEYLISPGTTAGLVTLDSQKQHANKVNVEEMKVAHVGDVVFKGPPPLPRQRVTRPK